MPDRGPQVDGCSLDPVDAIETTGLTKHYGGARSIVRRPGRSAPPPIRALDDLDLAVRPGEIFGFLGPNGAGKSTCIRLLLGFLHPTSGSARVLGLDAAADGVEVRRRVGYLPGGIALYDAMTGSELLAYLGAFYGRPATQRGRLVDGLELSARDLGRPVRGYSRGMRQKLGIVQALQHDPELAILDEPSEGLDPLMQRAFYEILDEVRAAGRTVFLSSHVLSEVERVCDRVAIVRHGRLVALEEIGTLLTRRRRTVEMRLDGPPPALDGVPGVSAVVVADGRFHCQLEGDVRPFLDAIGGAHVTDLTIEPARLEDAFLELYENGADDAGDGEAAGARDGDPAWADGDPAGAGGGEAAGGAARGAGR
jgi:ABC-2 type transport system ATP-binding protein